MGHLLTALECGHSGIEWVTVFLPDEVAVFTPIGATQVEVATRWKEGGRLRFCTLECLKEWIDKAVV